MLFEQSLPNNLHLYRNEYNGFKQDYLKSQEKRSAHIGDKSTQSSEAQVRSASTDSTAANTFNLLFKKSSRNANERNFINTNPICDMKAMCYPQTGLNSRKAFQPLVIADLEGSASMILSSKDQPSTSQQKSNLGGKASFLMQTQTNNFMREEP